MLRTTSPAPPPRDDPTAGPEKNRVPNRVPNSADLTPGNALEPPRIWLYRPKPSVPAPTLNPKVEGSIPSRPAVGAPRLAGLLSPTRPPAGVTSDRLTRKTPSYAPPAHAAQGVWLTALRMRISVVLTTCNGSRFLRQQLDSVAAQTRQPDELVA